MNNNLKGFAYGIATSVTFGLIPLFTLPLMEKGMRFDSILFYRFLFAAIALSGMLLAKKESFRTEMRNLPILILFFLCFTVVLCVLCILFLISFAIAIQLASCTHLYVFIS